MQNSGRFYELDFFRFLAAFSVLLFHYSFRGYAQGGYSPVSYPALAVVFKYGYLGVNLFFIISGFVILITAQSKDAFQFTVSRICRLYPAFWAGVTFTVAAALIFGNRRFIVGIDQYVENMSMISGYFGVRQVDGVYWTLLVEMKFYFLVFLLLLVRRIDQLENALWGWLGISGVAQFWHLPNHLVFFLIPNWSCYFIAGATFYLISQSGVRPRRILMLMLSFMLCLKGAYDQAVRFGADYQAHLSVPVIFGVILFFFVVFFLVALNKLKFFSNQRLMTIGALTYPLYLIHQYVGYMFFDYWYRYVNAWLLLFLVTAFMLTCAFLIYWFIERPLSRYMKELLNRARTWAIRTSLQTNAQD